MLSRQIFLLRQQIWNHLWGKAYLFWISHWKLPLSLSCDSAHAHWSLSKLHVEGFQVHVEGFWRYVCMWVVWLRTSRPNVLWPCRRKQIHLVGIHKTPTGVYVTSYGNTTDQYYFLLNYTRFFFPCFSNLLLITKKQPKSVQNFFFVLRRSTMQPLMLLSRNHDFPQTRT